MIPFGSLEIDPVDFGSSGNAILGIRDSGKTYTATLLAEAVFAAGIPFIAFDPIGVWRFLRVPGTGPGIPVVVAGGEAGDLPLSPDTAPALVEAAMAAGVSLVLDLHDINLSKADWKRIVASCLRVLLHKNRTHGLRHVFLEEAAEFAPQRISPDTTVVYSEVEKLARMGGNSRLGYTLINQRSEEVNKAVLELCDNLFLHRQKGRHSLTALGKWLDVGNVAARKEIIGSLSTMPTGECWAWLGGTDVPVRTKVPQKQSLHPDRRVMRGDAEAPAAKMVDVGKFVAGMQKQLSAPALKPAADVHAIEAAKRAAYERGDKAGYDRGFREGRARAISALRTHLDNILTAEGVVGVAGEDLKEGDIIQVQLVPPNPAQAIRASTAPAEGRVGKVATEASLTTEAGTTSIELSKPRQHILGVLKATQRLYRSGAVDKVLLAFLAEVSPSSSGYANNLGALRSVGLIEYPSGGAVALTKEGLAAAPDTPLPKTNDVVQRAVLGRLAKPRQRILEVLLEDHPSCVARAALAERAGVSATSSGFANNLGALRSLGLLEYPSGGNVSVTDLLFPFGAGR